LPLSRRRSGLPIAKEFVNGTDQLAGDYRFREQLVNPIEIHLGHGVEVHGREANNLRVRAKLPYEIVGLRFQGTGCLSPSISPR
jgi:hypothetical protein